MKVLTARLDSMGDVLLAGPAVRAVAAAATEVRLLCGPQGAAAGKLLPGVDGVFTWSAPWISDPAPDFTPGSARELLEMVTEFRPDAAVLFTSFHQSPLPLAALLRLGGVPRITGASIDYAGSLLTTRLKPGEDFPEDQPEVLRALDIAEAAGFPRPADTRLAVQLPEPSEPSRFTPTGPYVVVHPGAAAPARQWPPGHHRALVAELTRRGHTVVVTGTPAETNLTAHVAASGGIDLGGRTTLVEMARLLGGAQVLVTGNTGPAHLGAAMGAKIVSLFSPVVPAARWAPWGVPTILLGDQHAPCRNTRARNCPVPGHPCLTGLAPARVADACEQLIFDPERASTFASAQMEGAAQ